MPTPNSQPAPFILLSELCEVDGDVHKVLLISQQMQLLALEIRRLGVSVKTITHHLHHINFFHKHFERERALLELVSLHEEEALDTDLRLLRLVVLELKEHSRVSGKALKGDLEEYILVKVYEFIALVRGRRVLRRAEVVAIDVYSLESAPCQTMRNTSYP